MTNIDALKNKTVTVKTTVNGEAVELDLRWYDVILVNTSAGKDSLAMLDYVCGLAAELGILDRVVAVHCDLGRVEWEGTRELAAQQCKRYGVELHVVSRPQGDLLDHVQKRGMWPGPATRYCTSQHKRDQVTKLITRLVNDLIRSRFGGPVRVLNCMGLRAQESTARRKKPAVERNKRASNSKRIVNNWLPIHDWSEDRVWSVIRAKGLPYHYAYDLGMPRLSCAFCFFAPPEALLLAGYHNRELLDQYVAVEQKIGHSFQYDEKTGPQPLVQIQAQLAAGYVPQGKIDPSLWSQCA